MPTVIERKIAILTTFVHAMMSQSPIQAAEFIEQMKRADINPAIVCDVCGRGTPRKPWVPETHEEMS